MLLDALQDLGVYFLMFAVLLSEYFAKVGLKDF